MRQHLIFFEIADCRVTQWEDRWMKLDNDVRGAVESYPEEMTCDLFYEEWGWGPEWGRWGCEWRENIFEKQKHGGLAEHG